MRTITTNLYTISELSEDAKKKAIEEIRNEYYEINSLANSCDAGESLEKAFKITGVDAEIRENSQGVYCKSYTCDCENMTDDWDNVVQKIRQMPVDIWCDTIIILNFENYEYNPNITFVENIVAAYMDFIRVIHNKNNDLLSDDDGAIEYAIANNIEFFENGKQYK